MLVLYTKTFAIPGVGAGSEGQIVDLLDIDAQAVIAAECGVEYVEPVVDPDAPSPPPESIKSSGGPAVPGIDNPDGGALARKQAADKQEAAQARADAAHGDTRTDAEKRADAKARADADARARASGAPTHRGP